MAMKLRNYPNKEVARAKTHQVVPIEPAPKPPRRLFGPKNLGSTVIPRRRRLVKRMMFDSIVNSIKEVSAKFLEYCSRFFTSFLSPTAEKARSWLRKVSRVLFGPYEDKMFD